MLRRGRVPADLDDATHRTVTFAISKSAFLLRIPNGLSYYYRKGEGVVFDAPDDVGEAEVRLFADGSVYGAVAWLNGLVPLHASAIATDSGVWAFSAPSGEGKSTLASALGRRGWPVFSDDVLVVDRDRPDGLIALPGHRRVKLWRDAVALTGVKPGEAVRNGLKKYYAEDGLEFADAAMPLRRLVILSSVSNEPPGVRPLEGFERFGPIQAALYRSQFLTGFSDPGRYFEITSHLAARLPVIRFNRRRDRGAFDDQLAAIEQVIRDDG